MREASPSGESATVKATLFGPIELTGGQRRLGPGDLGGTKSKQVLELLLVARGHGVTKDRLADQLWGEALPKRAFAALENYVFILRRHLGPGGRGRELVVTEPGGYRLAAERVDLDLDRFDERISAAGRAGTRVTRKLLGEAVQAAARGEVLEDEPYAHWAEELRRTYRARLLGVRLDAAESALADRDTRSAIEHALAAMAIDPYAEQAHRLAMLAHYAQGEQRAGLAGVPAPAVPAVRRSRAGTHPPDPAGPGGHPGSGRPRLLAAPPPGTPSAPLPATGCTPRRAPGGAGPAGGPGRGGLRLGPGRRGG